MARWHLDLTVGDLVFPVTQWAPEDGPTGLALPQVLEVRWTDELEAEESRTWPVFTGPSTAQVVILMAEAADAAAITATTPVWMRLYTDPADEHPRAWFHGTASDPIIRPHDLGVTVTITCGDWLADLGQDTVGSSDWPAENTEDRFDRMFTAVGRVVPWLVPDAANHRWPDLAARPAGAVSLLAEAQSTIRQSVISGGPSGIYQGVGEVRPNLYEWPDGDKQFPPTLDVPDPVMPYTVDELSNEAETMAPGIIRLVEGVYRAVFPADATVWPNHNPVIPADATNFDATWGRRSSSDVNTLDVVWDGGKKVTRTTNKQAGEARVTERVEAPYLTTANDAAALGTALLPARPDTPGAAWEAERFTVQLRLAPEGWFPVDLRQVAIVDGIQAQHHPEGRSWWAGVVAFREVTISGGEVEVELGLIGRGIVLAPLDSIAIGSGSFHLNTLPIGMTYDNVDPALTIGDFAHIGTRDP